MRSKDLQIGKSYHANHSSGRVIVVLKQIKPHTFYGSTKTTNRYVCLNTSTGREIIFKSATKFTSEVIRPEEKVRAY